MNVNWRIKTSRKRKQPRDVRQRGGQRVSTFGSTRPFNWPAVLGLAPEVWVESDRYIELTASDWLVMQPYLLPPYGSLVPQPLFTGYVTGESSQRSV